MTYTTDRITQSTNVLDVVSTVQATINTLSTDEQLGLFWVIYENLGGAITPAAPGAAREQFTQGLLTKVKALSYEEQLQFMRDLVNRINNPLTRSYGVFTNNNKLAFWYQLAEGMTTGEIVPVPDDYKLSNAGLSVFSQITRLEFGQQITLLRKFVVGMGVDPLA
ncbi:Orange carotenoid protein [Xenococcus sp. PCC 7305]|uniref:orange carotenoid protein N-terminal domain-containing protein n=1 Tax=Xenococcus sp. PCC 7305 TaxID=102125 RepID=UPI0002AC90D4|nr:orange carotenoid protein N-terminal domain-containing protein [Xenococcus sp. PCC 7305]ELS05506.1 Orange carotenoid protein [Xenococcus sp. PCC 7305]